MKKLLAIVFLILLTFGNGWAETSPCVQPCTVDGRTGGTITSAITVTGEIKNTVDSANALLIQMADGTDIMQIDTTQTGSTVQTLLVTASGGTGNVNSVIGATLGTPTSTLTTNVHHSSFVGISENIGAESLIGIVSIAERNYSGSVTTMWNAGIMGQYILINGTIDPNSAIPVAGVRGEVFASGTATKSITEVAGVWGHVNIPSGATNTTYTDAASLWARAVTKSAGTITNAYGVYVENPTGGTNNYVMAFKETTAGTTYFQSSAEIALQFWPGNGSYSDFSIVETTGNRTLFFTDGDSIVIGNNTESTIFLNKNTLRFDGATDDTIEISFSITDPVTSDKTITVADYSGTMSVTQSAAALPATCTQGIYFNDTDSNDCINTAAGDGALCFCSATDTWKLVVNY